MKMRRGNKNESADHLLQILAKRLYLGNCESTYNNNNVRRDSILQSISRIHKELFFCELGKN